MHQSVVSNMRKMIARDQEMCATLKLWKMLDESIKSVVDKVTLEDLLEWQEEVGSDYVI